MSDEFGYIDAAIGCQNCGNALDPKSESPDFCSQSCQQMWYRVNVPTEPLVDYEEPWGSWARECNENDHEGSSAARWRGAEATHPSRAMTPPPFPGVVSPSAAFETAGRLINERVARDIEAAQRVATMGLRFGGGPDYPHADVHNRAALQALDRAATGGWVPCRYETMLMASASPEILELLGLNFRLPRSTGDLAADWEMLRHAEHLVATDEQRAACALRRESLEQRQREAWSSRMATVAEVLTGRLRTSALRFTDALSELRMTMERNER